MVGSGDFQKAWHTFCEAFSPSTKQSSLEKAAYSAVKGQLLALLLQFPGSF